MATIITKNSSTASSVPLNTQLVQGELAVNVTDKRLFTENASGTVVELGTNPSSLALPNGSANGVAYLNGSKVLTTGSALTFDGSVFGITGGTGIQLKMYNSGLTGTQASSIGVGKSETSGNTVFLGWANNGGSPFGYLGTYGGGSPLVLQPDGGNLGLGVTPSAWSGASSNFQLVGGAFIATSSSYGRFGANYYYGGGYKYTTSDYATLYEHASGSHKWYIAPSGTAGNAISFTQAMTLDASGRLSVATTSPTSGGFNPTIAAKSLSDSIGGGIMVEGSGADATLNMGYDGASMFISSSYRTTAGYKPIAFYTSGTERARIDSSGNLLVGSTTSPTVSYGNPRISTGSSAFCVMTDSGVYEGQAAATALQYVALWKNPNGTVGSIATNGSSTTYATSSDYRLKNNIAPMTGALAKVAALKPCTYKWKADGSDGEGFIAHELAEVVPQCVTGEKDAVDAEGNPVYQGIDTSFLVATLTAAIQELKAELDSVKSELASLKGN